MTYFCSVLSARVGIILRLWHISVSFCIYFLLSNVGKSWHHFRVFCIFLYLFESVFWSVLSATVGNSWRGKNETTGNTRGNRESGFSSFVAQYLKWSRLLLPKAESILALESLSNLSQVSSTSGEDGTEEDADENSATVIKQTTQQWFIAVEPCQRWW